MSNFQITTSKHRTTIMGIAMIAIMLFHQYFTSVFPFNAFHNFGYWGVDVFLFLSGMGLVKSLNNNPLKIFYAHRFYRIIPCCILCGSVKYLIFHLLGSSVAILKAGLNIGLLSILSFDLWFIPAIIILYSITPLLFQALSKWTYTTILLVLLLFVLNGIFIRPNIGFDLTLTGILSRTAERLPVFMAGMYVVMKEEWIDSKIRYSYSFLITAILLKLLCKAGLPIPCNQVCIYFALTMGMPALISFISIIIAKTPYTVTKAISLFGHYSLEFYLVHEFIFWSLIVIYNNANPFLMLILGFIISGISAILSKWIIEKFKPKGKGFIIRKQMKHTKIYILISVICILGGITVKVYNYFAPPILRTPYRMTENKNTCDIAFIGDSWACLHLDHNCTITTLLKDSFSYNSDVFSFGLSGKTSKEIYEAMYDNNDFIQFLQRRAYKYCVIAAGINDVNKKMSTRYYKESMNGIIQLLLYNDIHPIILEIPDFDVYKVYGWWRFDKKMLRRFSMEIYDIPIDCKQLFRDALDELIKEKGYQNKVSILRYKSWNNDYQNDLKTIYSSDGLHLNKYGYAVLDSIIANKIRYQEKETISMP